MRHLGSIALARSDCHVPKMRGDAYVVIPSDWATLSKAVER